MNERATKWRHSGELHLIGIDGHHVGRILQAERLGLLLQRGKHVDWLAALHRRRAGADQIRIGEGTGWIAGRAAQALLQLTSGRAERMVVQAAEMTHNARIAQGELVARAAQMVAAIVRRLTEAGADVRAAIVVRFEVRTVVRAGRRTLVYDAGASAGPQTRLVALAGQALLEVLFVFDFL